MATSDDGASASAPTTEDRAVARGEREREHGQGPDDAPRGAPQHAATGRESATRRDARRARTVTLTLLAVLVLGAATEAEVWPVTAFRLFSTVRTHTSVRLELVLVRADGTTTPWRPRAHDDVVGVTTHQFAQLPHLDPVRARAKVDAWLDLADTPRESVATVRLDRVTSRFDDTTGRWADTDRRTELEVAP